MSAFVHVMHLRMSLLFIFLVTDVPNYDKHNKLHDSLFKELRKWMFDLACVLRSQFSDGGRSGK